MTEELPRHSQNLETQAQSNAPVDLLHNSRAPFDDGFDVGLGPRAASLAGELEAT